MEDRKILFNSYNRPEYVDELHPIARLFCEVWNQLLIAATPRSTLLGSKLYANSETPNLSQNTVKA